jgi:hypothetical protein
MRSVVFWVVMQCSLAGDCKHSEGIYHLYFHVYLEDESEIILQNVGIKASKPQSTFSLPRKYQISKSIMFVHLNVSSLKMLLCADSIQRFKGVRITAHHISSYFRFYQMTPRPIRIMHYTVCTSGLQIEISVSV